MTITGEAVRKAIDKAFTRANKKVLCKEIQRRMSGISLCVTWWVEGSGLTSCHLFRDSVVQYDDGVLSFYGSGHGLNHCRIIIKNIVAVKRFEIKRYDVKLPNNMLVTLEEYLY